MSFSFLPKFQNFGIRIFRIPFYKVARGCACVVHVSKLASGMCCGAYSVVCTRNIMLFGLIIMCADRVCYVFSLCWLMECNPRTLYILYIYVLTQTASSLLKFTMQRYGNFARTCQYRCCKCQYKCCYIQKSIENQ